ncbi:MAG: recombination regulator RecX [Janthinobacterium lividum]
MSERDTHPLDEEVGDGSPEKDRRRPGKSLFARALGYLSRREYSRAELAGKLAPHVVEGDSIDALLDRLEAENWLSNSRFTDSLVHRRASRFGAARIVMELKRHSVDQTLIETVQDQLRESEGHRAKAVWERKFGGELPRSPEEYAKQSRFLASRGFSGQAISRLLRGRFEPDESI